MKPELNRPCKFMEGNKLFDSHDKKKNSLIQLHPCNVHLDSL